MDARCVMIETTFLSIPHCVIFIPMYYQTFSWLTETQIEYITAFENKTHKERGES